MKIAIVTCITQGFDTSLEQPFFKDVDYFLFTDDVNNCAKGWKAIDISNLNKKYPHKYIKMHSHKWLNGYDVIMWIDANMVINKYQLSNLKTLWANANFYLCRHNMRSNVYDEIDKCISVKKDTEDILKKQRDYLKALNVDKNVLYQSGIIIYKPTKENIAFLHLWYNETIKFSKRDQISILSALKKSSFKISDLPPNVLFNLVKINSHKKFVNKNDFNIYEFVPFDLDKNIARGINRHCALVPNDNDWIIIRDGDTMYTRSDWQKIVHEVIKRHGGKYKLFGAKTNRVNRPHQRIKGMEHNFDLRQHYKKGQDLFDKHQYDVEVNNLSVSGFFMCFPKYVWNEFKFNEKKPTSFDTLFFQDVKRRYACADIKGLYIIHLFRLWEEDINKAKKSINHLL